MAEALLRQALEQRGLASEVIVSSAGVRAVAGYPASEDAGDAVSAYGVDISTHRSRPLTVALVEESTLVLVMEERHRRAIFNMSPQALRRVYLLTEMAGQSGDVPDPYGRELESYVDSAAFINGLIQAGLPRILTLAGTSRSPQ